MPAFAHDYDYDVFVSYARVDNNPVRGIEVGWVSHFVDTLENLLAQELGRSDLFEVWMDLKGARTLPELLDRVERSATFLMILSPGFLASPWCPKELECFMNMLEAQPQQDGLTRIFIVEKTVRNVQCPPGLGDLIRYPLWYRDDNARVRTRGLPEFDPKDLDYYFTIQDIAADLSDELKRLNGASPDVS